MAVLSPVAGTRNTPIDGYDFLRGTTATFKITYKNGNIPTKIDTGTFPSANIYIPHYLAGSAQSAQVPIATLTGALVSGQEFEYEFIWDIPNNIVPNDEYIITYHGFLGGFEYNFGDEYFSIAASPSQIGLSFPSYATVSDVRMMKFNIDEYLPDSYKGPGSDALEKRNNLIEFHLNVASNKLRGELALFRQKGNNENFRLFTVYWTIYSLLLSARGEDGSSVSDQNLNYWKSEANAILAQEKRQSLGMGISFSRG